MLCQLKCCQKCEGDLVLDGEEWRCWQCGHYYYPRTSLPELQVDERGRVTLVAEPEAPEMPRRRRRRSRWAVPDINRLIVAKDRSEQKWWNRNEPLIKLLDAGRSVKEVAQVSGRSERQVRIIREQLNDIRAVA